MPRKVAWIAFWMTLMFWLGGFWGCAGTGDDQNYELLNEDEQLFEGEPPTLQSREEIATELDVALNEPAQQPQEQPVDEHVDEHVEELVDQPVEEPSVAPVEVASDQAPVEIEPADEAPQPADAQSGYVLLAQLATDEPSLKGIDRSHWSPVTVTPSYGTTVHHPIYFSDINVRNTQIRVEKPQVALDSRGADGLLLTIDAYDEAALLASLDGPRAGNISNSTNQWDLLWQPSKFGLDLIFLPVNAVFAPPLKPVTTPPVDKASPTAAE